VASTEAREKSAKPGWEFPYTFQTNGKQADQFSGAILAELDITGWNLHNAGNDAVYTLQAMIRISIYHILDKQKQKQKQVKEQENRERVAESVKDATLVAWEKEEGWSSGGENSDGGAPVTPSAPTPVAKKPIQRNPEPPKYAQGLWKAVSNPGSIQGHRKTNMIM